MSWRLFLTCSKLMRFSINQHKKIFNTKIISINIFFYQRKLKKIRSFINDSSSIISTGQKSIFTLKYSVIFVVFSIASNTRGKENSLRPTKSRSDQKWNCWENLYHFSEKQISWRVSDFYSLWGCFFKF